MTYKAYFKKELLEHQRTFRLLIIFAVTLVTAITSPLMVYFLPKILSSQLETTESIAHLFQIGQMPGIQSFQNDLLEIPGTIMLVFAAIIVYNEYKKKAIVLPLTNGLKHGAMILMKFLTYCLLIAISVIVSAVINHYYSGLIFDEWTADFLSSMIYAMNFSFYMMYHIALCFFIIVYTKKLFIGILLPMISYIGLPSLIKLFVNHSPYHLLSDSFDFISIITAICCIIVLVMITMKRKVVF